MQVAVTFRHMESTDALKDYANEKVAKVTKYLSRATNAHVILCVEKLEHKAEVLIDAGGIHCRGEAHSENMYKSIDEATEKIVRQVKRYQGKIHKHKHKQGLADMAVTHSVFELPEDAANNDSVPHQVTETKQIQARPMSVDEAVMQMDLIHNDFFIFQNVDSGQVNVIYRRESGRYGLIEAQTR
jgi:putative sigma-54 modulation protein